MDGDWIEVCGVEEIEREDVIRFDYEGRSLAVYRTDQDRYYATDGFCTHQKFHLAEGFVIGNVIECPKHNGHFDIATGKAKKVPACIDLKTYPTEVSGGKVYVRLSD